MNMYPSSRNLSTENGLKIQAEQLATWKEVLNEKCYLALYNHCMEKNKSLIDDELDGGYKVFRGSDMDNYVSNLALVLREANKK